MAYLAGKEGLDVGVLADALEQRAVVMAPVVLAELFTDPGLTEDTGSLFRTLLLLDPTPG